MLTSLEGPWSTGYLHTLKVHSMNYLITIKETCIFTVERSGRHLLHQVTNTSTAVMVMDKLDILCLPMRCARKTTALNMWYSCPQCLA